MIKVRGSVTVRVNYEIKLNMTEEEFDALPERKQNELIEESIDWQDAMRSAETDDVDVWEIDEI